MAIYDLWLSRNNGPTVANYVGHTGRLFFDPAERVLRISDGTTAGGEVFNGIVTVANTEPTANFQGQIWLNPEDSALSVYHNGNFIPTIDVATTTKLGGVKLGPGVTTNGEGQIIIDSEGLDFSFGDLAATVGTYTDESEYAVLSTINTDEDMVLASNGTGGIQVVGEFRVHATNGALTETLETEPAFRIKSDGQIRILVPEVDATEGAVAIVGSSTGEFIAPVNTGVMLHVTGNLSESGIAS
jgi:putative NIF3 family GTP cyclohydrolase 1 type 2